MIDFKVNGKVLASFKYFMWSYKDMYFLRLESTDIDSHDGMVYPLYKPLIFLERHPGQFVLNISPGKKVLAIVFQKMRPYLSFDLADIAVLKTEVIDAEDEM